ncbi:hypothetical protein SISSUDRAFT_1042176 [Sistotremastrum suecicum HHB10207 ss-3]|uniref:Uncharacterized protein n=1 Tax=Sistotremastrum suecicum HHB10207 ss-3 TaxID=1314776 RepID=A0A166GR81_9AGAM|nr:hypothetical protein SISSUDRAFT_1042176 [Sistotremastrum suecicum HHB10207 ss-3]
MAVKKRPEPRPPPFGTLDDLCSTSKLSRLSDNTSLSAFVWAAVKRFNYCGFYCLQQLFTRTCPQICNFYYLLVLVVHVLSSIHSVSSPIHLFLMLFL